MIVKFKCSNFKSILDMVEFSMQAAPQKFEQQLPIKTADGLCSRFSAVYGQNGTGKSSLIDAIALFKRLIITNNVYQPGLPLLQQPHKLAFNQPTIFEMTFIKNDIKYSYRVEYTSHKIINESLYYWPTKRQTLIFSRDENKIVGYNKTFSKLEEACAGKYDDNKLFFVAAVNNTDYQVIKDAYIFFANDIVIFSDQNNWFDYSTSLMEFDENAKRKIIDFMHKYGFDFTDIKAHVELVPVKEQEIPANLPEGIRASMLSQAKRIPVMKLKYANGIELDILEESKGTQKLMQLVGPMLDIIQNGKVLLCDEFERNLHPLILQGIVDLFLNNQLSEAQLIVTTHALTLMDLKLIRRDQIWFTALHKAERCTDLFRLSSLSGVRKNESIAKNYLKGRYNNS